MRCVHALVALLFLFSLPPAATVTAVEAGAAKVGPQGAQLAKAPGITLEGRVVDRAGNPVAGAKITTAKSEPQRPADVVMRSMTRDARDAKHLITTGADGRFRLRLPAGSWDVLARRAGYAPRLHRAVDIRPGVKPMTITLDEGFTLSGRVVRKDGSGVPEVTIDVGGKWYARTEEDGSFAFPDLERGRVELRASKSQEFIAERRVVKVPAPHLVIELPPTGTIRGRVIERTSKKPVTHFEAGLVEEGHVHDVSLRSEPYLGLFGASGGTFELTHVPVGAQELLVRAPGYVHTKIPRLVVEEGKVVTVEAMLEAGTRVTGRVSLPNGSPAVDAEVRRLHPQAEGMATMPPPPDDVVTTDGQGRFTIEGVPQGEHLFRASMNGLVSDSQRVKVSGREITVEFRLVTGGSILGVVVTESGAPVADAEVVVTGESGRYMTKSDAAGAFRFELLAPEPYLVRATRSGYFTAELAGVPAEGTRLRLILYSGGSTVRGRVTRNGQAVAGASMIFTPADSPQGRSAKTDANGSYELVALKNGGYQVRIFGMQTLSSFTTAYTVNGPGTFDIEIRATPVRGVVLDSSSSKPMAGVRLDLTERPFRGVRTAVPVETNAAGEFFFETVLPGSYTLRASKPKYVAKDLDVVVGPSAVNGLELRLQRTVGAAVQLIDARDGRDIQGIATVMDGEGRVVYHGGVRSEGKDEPSIISLRAPGTYEAEFWAEGYGQTTRSFQFPGPPLVVALTPGGELVVEWSSTKARAIRFVDASGRRVRYRLVPSILYYSGVNRLGHFAPGTYFLEILDAAGATVAREKFVIVEGKVTTIRK